MDEYLTLNQGVDEFESLPEHMSKIEKKRKKLSERLKSLEEEMLQTLKQKNSSTGDSDMRKYLSEIDSIRKTLIDLK